MRLAVCILHYGSPDTTSRLHRQLLEAEPERAGDILVLDNAAPLPYPDAWIRLPHNRYWAGAFAWALDELESTGYTHVWFCNNDMVFVSPSPYMSRAEGRWSWLERRGRVGMLSPSVTTNPYHAQMKHVPGGECREAAYIDGIAPLVSLDCVRALGGLDCADNIFGYGVDVWLSCRAARAGWGVWVDHSLVVRHQYHTAAKQDHAFLSRAAVAEDAYLGKRLGPGWRETLKGLQQTPQETIREP